MGILSSESEDLLHAQITVVKTRRAESVLSKVAISQTVHQRQSVGSKRHDELTANQRTRKRTEIPGDRIENQSSVRVVVRAITATAVTVRVNTRKNREGLTRLARDDTRNLPSAEDLTSDTLLEEMVIERRDFIDEVANESMFAIEG